MRKLDLLKINVVVLTEEIDANIKAKTIHDIKRL